MNTTHKDSLLKWLLVWGVSIGAFAVSFTTTSIMTAIPVISEALHLSDAQATWAVNVYMLGAASLIIMGGRMGDRFNPRRVFYAGGLVFAIGSILVATANNVGYLLAGRVIQGLAVALIIPNSLAIIKGTFGNKDKEKIAVGIWSAIISLGFATGPLFAGLLIDSIGWHAVFWVTIPILALSFLICSFIKNPKAVIKTVKIDYIGQALLAAGIFLFAFALTESIQWGWSNGWTWAILIASLLIFTVFYFLEKYVDQPAIKFSIFKNKQFTYTFALIFLTFYSLISVLFIYNIFVQNPATLAYDAMQAGSSLLPTTLCIFVLSFLMPRLGNKIGFRYPSVICFLLMAIGFFLFFLIKADVSYANLWIPLILIGLGLGGTFPCFAGLALSKLSSDQTGLGSGIVSVGMYATAIISTAISSTIYLKITFHQILSQLSTLTTVSHANLVHFASLVSAGKPLDISLAAIPNRYHAAMLSAAKTANVHAFNTVMLVTAILCVVGALVSLLKIQDKE